MSLKIRTAQESDIDSIMNIEKEAFLPEIQEIREVFLERIRIFPDGFLIFEDENHFPVGYLSSELWENIPLSDSAFCVGHNISDLFCKNGKILYISSFALLKKMHGKGEGKRLFNLSIEFIKEKTGCEKGCLLVNDLWKGARHIYEANGFEYKSTIKKAFPNSDGIFMIRESL